MVFLKDHYEMSLIANNLLLTSQDVETIGNWFSILPKIIQNPWLIMQDLVMIIQYLP